MTDEPKIDLENDPAFQLKDMPTYLSKGVVAGMSENKETGEQIMTLVQTLELNPGEFIAVVQPMDVAGIDALIKTLYGVKQQLTTHKTQACLKLWTTQLVKDSGMPKTPRRHLKGQGTVMDVYRMGPTAVGKLKGMTPESISYLDAWFKGHEIAWPDPEDNHMDPRNKGMKPKVGAHGQPPPLLDAEGRLPEG